jgi:hypothetical protein
LEVHVGKIIFALLTAAIAWVLFKGLTKKSSGEVSRRDVPKPSADKAKNLNAPERMVKCVRCGVFMPETESVIVEGQISCRDPQACAHGRA